MISWVCRDGRKGESEYGVSPWVTGSRLVPFNEQVNTKEEQVEGKGGLVLNASW